MSILPPVRVSVGQSAQMIQLEIHWMGLDEIWYGPIAVGVHPKSFF